jgi:hypothetical protein
METPVPASDGELRGFADTHKPPLSNQPPTPPKSPSRAHRLEPYFLHSPVPADQQSLLRRSFSRPLDSPQRARRQTRRHGACGRVQAHFRNPRGWVATPSADRHLGEDVCHLVNERVQVQVEARSGAAKGARSVAVRRVISGAVAKRNVVNRRRYKLRSECCSGSERQATPGKLPAGELDGAR